MQDLRFNIENTDKLGSAHRLLRNVGYSHVLKAKQFSCEYFKIFVVANTCNVARLGIIASKKLLPRAVDRNQVKRNVRELFRQHSIKNANIDVVFMLKNPNVKELSAKNADLNSLLSRVERLCANI